MSDVGEVVLGFELGGVVGALVGAWVGMRVGLCVGDTVAGIDTGEPDGAWDVVGAGDVVVVSWDFVLGAGDFVGVVSSSSLCLLMFTSEDNAPGTVSRM